MTESGVILMAEHPSARSIRTRLSRHLSNVVDTLIRLRRHKCNFADAHLTKSTLNERRRHLSGYVDVHLISYQKYDVVDIDVIG
jgi:hypothetical protein